MSQAATPNSPATNFACPIESPPADMYLLGTEQPAPHYSTLSRRAVSLDVRLQRPSTGPLHLAVASTGVKLYGEGGWKVRTHGAGKRRTWRKLHLLVDHRTQEALACSMTEQYVLDRGRVAAAATRGGGRGG